MKREVIITADGSTTIHLPELNEQYHSKHGAIQEAYHVFIKNGLEQFKEKLTISILEMGFGTGLNCFITFLEAQKLNLMINYVGIEAFPVKEKEIKQLNYVEALNAKNESDVFCKFHTLKWNAKHKVSESFSLEKREQFFEEIDNINQFDLIYFDVFGARVQPELWTEVIFKKMFEALNLNGILVTYAAKGSARRAMQQVGFTVEKLAGPPGKREMLRAKKI